MKHKGRAWKWFLGTGVVLGVGALVWVLVAIPSLVKFPTDMKASPHYAGTFTLYVNPANGSPLAQPTQYPMTIDRQLASVANQSGANNVVVDEVITQKAGPLTTNQHNVYVFDRRTMKNVQDSKAMVFGQPDGSARAGMYRINLPFDTSKDGSYTIAKNETGTGYPLNGHQPTVKRSGLTLDQFTGSMTNQPVSPQYVAWLASNGVPLPQTVTLQQLAPQLAAAGIDVNALVTALTPILSPTDAATINQAVTRPITVNYVYSFQGRAGVESTTGADVTTSATESLAAAPDLTVLAPLGTVLQKYQTVPAVAAVLPKLAAVTTMAPSKVFEYTYDQTPASVADIAKQVSDRRDQIIRVKYWVPGGLLLLALIGLSVGGFMWWRGRPVAAAVQPIGVVPTAEPGPQRKAG